jgi:ataxia telangiectasia mutated family protein
MFPSPEAFVAARLAYTRSTAVASVVGYIAGISDRHYNNIMVHCSPGENASAGEVLHIDFGIVFEQGLLLPTPETVPFRLTRDIVAGFGVANTRGAFSSSMEKSLQVLRSNADTIMGVFTVLLHDPLCKWVLTDEKARKVLRTRSVKGAADEGNDNEDGGFIDATSGHDHKSSFDGSTEKHDVAAMHVLKRIDSKLRGTDFVSISTSSSSSVLPVHAQVERLLDMAQDMDALSRLFSGWHAWC